MRTTATVGLVLLNWNSADLVRACLATVRNGNRAPDYTVIVDNGSTDGEAERLKDIPDVQLLWNQENRGFAHANNQGIEHLLGLGVDCVWVLNSDTLVDPACLERCLSYMTQHADVGVVSPTIVFADAPDRIWFGGGDVDTRTFRAQHWRTQPPEPKQCGFVSGCSFIARREVFLTAGGFHPSYFAYFEDVEWSLRVREANIACVVLPNASVQHIVSAVLKQNLRHLGKYPPFYFYLYMRNWMYTIRLHSGGTARVHAGLRWAAYGLYLFVGFAAKGRVRKIASLLRGMLAGMATTLAAAPPMRADIRTASGQGPEALKSSPQA